MGDKRINSSIGSQWKYRIDIVDEQIGELAKLMTSEQQKNNYLNGKLTYKRRFVIWAYSKILRK